MAEARTTLRVVRAREGDLKGAVSMGMRALEGERKSVPSLLIASRDLTRVLHDRCAGETRTHDYLDQLTAPARSDAKCRLEKRQPGPGGREDVAQLLRAPKLGARKPRR